MQKLPLNVIKKCYDSDTARVRVSFFPQHLERAVSYTHLNKEAIYCCYDTYMENPKEDEKGD